MKFSNLMMAGLGLFLIVGLNPVKALSQESFDDTLMGQHPGSQGLGPQGMEQRQGGRRGPQGMEQRRGGRRGPQGMEQRRGGRRGPQGMEQRRGGQRRGR